MLYFWNFGHLLTTCSFVEIDARISLSSYFSSYWSVKSCNLKVNDKNVDTDFSLHLRINHQIRAGSIGTRFR
ncbi:hypothetical protein L1887_18954 [Cichorium endivia]|nr:hypothetical protein L1887_18954 [Cichorium endivia]